MARINLFNLDGTFQTTLSVIEDHLQEEIKRIANTRHALVVHNGTLTYPDA